MALSFLKVRADFDQVTEALTDEEKGRLLLAMVRYAQDGEEPQLSGSERILWPVFRADIDHDMAVYQTKVENGKQPKRNKSENPDNQPEADGSEPNRTEADGSELKRTEAENSLVFKEKEAEKENEKEERSKEVKDKEKGEEKERENAPAREETQGFELFWSDYPRKEGKKAARKAWDKIRPGQDQLGQILNALRIQKKSDQWTRDGGQYIPHPATWLNGERWKDETVVPARASPPAVIAQRYMQRDYSGEQEDAMRRMLAVAEMAGAP